MTYYYTHKSKHHSALIRDASSCSWWVLTQRPTTQQCEGSKSPTWGVSIKLLPSRLRDLCSRGERKLAIPRKQHLPDTAERIPIFTETMTTLTRLTRVHTRRNSSAVWGRWILSPTPTKSNLQLISAGKVKFTFFSNRVSLGVSTTLKGRSHAQESTQNGCHVLLTSFCSVFSIFFVCFFFFLVVSLSGLNFWEKEKNNMKMGG